MPRGVLLLRVRSSGALPAHPLVCSGPCSDRARSSSSPRPVSSIGRQSAYLAACGNRELPFNLLRPTLGRYGRAAPLAAGEVAWPGRSGEVTALAPGDRGRRGGHRRRVHRGLALNDRREVVLAGPRRRPDRADAHLGGPRRAARTGRPARRAASAAARRSRRPTRHRRSRSRPYAAPGRAALVTAPSTRSAVTTR